MKSRRVPSLLRSRLLAGSTVASRSKWNNYLYIRLTDLLYYDGLDYKNVNKELIKVFSLWRQE